MTDELHRNTLLTKTIDVASEEQIVIFEAGKIDLTYGHDRVGILHIIQDHINNMDFATLDEALKVIEDVLLNGTYTEDESKYVIEKDDYRVRITKDEKK